MTKKSRNRLLRYGKIQAKPEIFIIRVRKGASKKNKRCLKVSYK